MCVRLAEQQAGENVAAANQPTDCKADTDDDQDEDGNGAEFQDDSSSLREEGPEAMELRQEEKMQEIDVQAPSADKGYRPTGFALSDHIVQPIENVCQQQHRGEGEYPFDEEVDVGYAEVEQYEAEDRDCYKDQLPVSAICPAGESLET